MVLHAALREKQAVAEKDGWYTGKYGNPTEKKRLNEEAAENEALAERIFKVLGDLMETRN